MKKPNPNAIATTLTILALPAFIQAAHAATSGPIDEIIVTAQKRVQAISDVGMSINAVTGDTLKQLNVTSAADLNKITPGLSVVPSNTGIAGAPVFTLRGVGFNENSLSALSAVSFYVDEVALPYVYMAGGPTLDIERVEVLKGPQGTLFGQNATGGAVNYIARHPTEHFEAGIEGSLATYNRMDVDGYVSGPLSDTVKARLALRSVTAKGWQESTSRSDTLGEVDQQAGRFLLDWNPTDKLLVELNLNGWLDRSESQAAQLAGFNPAIEVVPLPGGGSVNFFAPGFALPIPGTVSPYGQVTNGVVKPNKITAADWTPGRDYGNHTYFTQESLRLEWEMNSDITLTSLTANSRYRKNDFHDTDTNAGDFGTYKTAGNIKAFSQELRLNGEAWDRLNWITGVSYAEDHIKTDNLSLSGSSTTGLYLAGLNPAGAGVVSDAERKTKAVFASGDYDLTDTVSLTAGIRYTDVKLDYTGCSQGIGGDLFDLLGLAGKGECFTLGASGLPGQFSQSMDETNTSWRGGINWKVTPDMLVYGFISRGFKSGDFPSLVALSTEQLKPVKQEQLTAYEIGVKSHLFDNKVAVNAAAFYYDYKDKQLYSLVPVPFLGGTTAIAESTINVPKSHVEGGELDLTWFPLEGLTLHTGVGYTHSVVDGGSNPIFTGFSSPTWPPAAGFTTIGMTDISGSSFNLAPEWQVNFDGQYQWRINDMMNAFVGASAIYASKTTAFLGVNDGPSSIPEYGTLDLRAGLESPDGRWRASVWGRNVTDELYVVSVTRNYDTTSRFVGQPSTYGLTVSYKFD